MKQRAGPALALLLALGSACGRRGVESAADEAYAAGRYADAYAVYAASAEDDGGDLWLKAAAAARRAGRPDLAAAALEKLVAEDPARRNEAADAMEEVMAAADQAADATGLRIALAAHRRLVPDRPAGRWILALLRRSPVAADEAVEWLPAALAAAPGRTAFDTLLFRYARALESEGDCAGAVPAYESVLRRRPDSTRGAGSRAGVSRCGLTLGAAALGSGDAMAADRWYTRVAESGAGGAVERRALVGLGDARVAQGDTIAAVIAWQRAADAGAGDSIGLMARRRIRAAAGANEAGDSARVGD